MESDISNIRYMFISNLYKYAIEIAFYLHEKYNLHDLNFALSLLIIFYRIMKNLGYADYQINEIVKDFLNLTRRYELNNVPSKADLVIFC